MTRIDCLEVEQLLSGFLENGLEETTLQAVRSHLNSCEACSLLITDMQAGMVLCQSFQNWSPPLAWWMKFSTEPRAGISLCLGKNT